MGQKVRVKPAHKLARHVLMLTSVTLLSACGGGGGGGSDGGSAELQHINVNFTEDTSLNDSITGAWVATSELDYSYSNSYSGVTTTTFFKGQERNTLFIVADTPAPQIFDCQSQATTVSEGATTLAFDFHGEHYEVEKNSNTRMTATVSESGNNIGSVTFIKVKPAAATIEEIRANFSAGTLLYNYRKASGQMMDVDCYSDSQFALTRKSDVTTYVDNEETFTLWNFNGDRVEGETYDGPKASSQVVYITNYIGDVLEHFASDESGTTVSFSVRGTNRLSVNFDGVAAERTIDASSDVPSTFSGSAELDF